MYYCLPIIYTCVLYSSNTLYTTVYYCSNTLYTRVLRCRNTLYATVYYCSNTLYILRCSNTTVHYCSNTPYTTVYYCINTLYTRVLRCSNTLYTAVHYCSNTLYTTVLHSSQYQPTHSINCGCDGKSPCCYVFFSLFEDEKVLCFQINFRTAAFTFSKKESLAIYRKTPVC
jgi:hypothetical protein